MRLPEREYYPFFSWFLFDRVPGGIQSEFALRTTLAGKTILYPPMILGEHMQSFLDNSIEPTEYWNLINYTAWALLGNNNADAEKYRSMLEVNFTIRPLEYEIVRVTYNPIERWRQRTYIITPIAIFHVK